MFFGIDWFTALMKISFQIVFAIVTALPFCKAWNHAAPIYFKTFLPEIWIYIPYWDVVALLLVISYVGESINKLTPKLVSVSQSNSK